MAKKFLSSPSVAYVVQYLGPRYLQAVQPNFRLHKTWAVGSNWKRHTIYSFVAFLSVNCFINPTT